MKTVKIIGTVLLLLAVVGGVAVLGRGDGEHVHVYGTWKNDTATCNAKGVETRVCLMCSETETRETDYRNHNFEDTRVGLDGVLYSVCTYCNCSEGSRGLDIVDGVVVGIGTCEDEDIIIPQVGNGVLVHKIADYAFEGCQQIKSLSGYPSSIGKYAFSNCFNLKTVNSPNDVLGFDDGAFFNCVSLQNVSAKGLSTSIGSYAFANCPALSTIDAGYVEVNELNNLYRDMGTSIFLNSDSAVITCKDGIIVPGDGIVCLYRDNSSYLEITAPYYDLVNHNTDIVIKASYNGIPLKKIGYAAFTQCSDLTGVEIPEGVTEVASNAFYKCSNLVNVSMPNSLTALGASVFSGCGNLKYNVYDKGCYLGNEDNPYVVLHKAAVGAESGECVLSDKTRFIHSGAFQNVSITEILIPASVIHVGAKAFYGSGIVDLYIATTGATSGQDAFESMGAIENIYYAGTWEQLYSMVGYFTIEESSWSSATIHYEYEYEWY